MPAAGAQESSSIRICNRGAWRIPSGSMRRSSSAIALIALVCLHAVPCAAGYISFELTPSSSFSAEGILVSLVAVNRGDEPATTLRVEASVGGNRVHSDVRDTLAPGEEMLTRLKMPSQLDPPGVYTIIVKLDYRDQRGHPFSALTSIPLTNAETDDEEALSANLTSAHLTRSGEIRLTLRNSENEALKAAVSLILPRDLECRRTNISAVVAPNETHATPFRIGNVSAFPGSTYRVFAVIDYVRNDRHRSFAAPASITIPVAAQPLSPRARNTWIAIIIALLALFVAIQFIRKKTPDECE